MSRARPIIQRFNHINVHAVGKRSMMWVAETRELATKCQWKVGTCPVPGERSPCYNTYECFASTELVAVLSSKKRKGKENMLLLLLLLQASFVCSLCAKERKNPLHSCSCVTIPIPTLPMLTHRLSDGVRNRDKLQHVRCGPKPLRYYHNSRRIAR